MRIAMEVTLLDLFICFVYLNKLNYNGLVYE